MTMKFEMITFEINIHSTFSVIAPWLSSVDGRLHTIAVDCLTHQCRHALWVGYGQRWCL
ncbi:hypothetical protein XBJ2_520018 [Xenorhabdus bovienii str. Jollieti]|uniref:Uncharacterized protein n=1 Tax=Xenorhabdus bovienii (strain SS-2004) TaxID=406818 RepID=D3UXM0_XENBS|nr:hypothetical protein XBJ1_1262 [Xenorhabdus bovienii SS-2004]CDH30097.1 hypothetical protein XBJ2_520018 [Xenorhabdus bovienii str. Jollieti]